MAIVKKILFICPTNLWNTRERNLKFDCELLLEEGHHVQLYCTKGSPIDLLSDQRIEKHYQSGSIHINLSSWPKLKTLSKLLADPNLNLVHCYKLNILWAVCFFLRGNRHTSLILTQHYALKKNYWAFWNRLLIRRCDLVFVPFEILVKNVWRNLGIHPRKVQLRPPSLPRDIKVDPKPTIFNKFDQFYSIGIYVSLSDLDAHIYESQIRALRLINELNLFDRDVKIVFITDDTWHNRDIYSALKQLVLDIEVEEHVIFHAENKPVGHIELFDLWTGSFRENSLEDMGLLAMTKLVPTLFPKYSSAVRLLEKYGKVGETYKNNDVRSIVRKWTALLCDKEDYQSQIHKGLKELNQAYSAEKLGYQYISAFNKLFKRRNRYMQRTFKR